MISPYILEMQSTTASNIVPYDFHMHTKFTDGESSVEEMHAQAISQGLRAILFSEHARKSSGPWFQEFAQTVRSLPHDQCLALVGVESKVADFSGELDLSDEIYNTVDLVMASVHRFPGETGSIKGNSGGLTSEQAIDREFRLSMAVLENPRVDILGHPFGMSYRRFKAAPPADLFKKLIQKAADQSVAVEINPHYHPEPWQIYAWCKEFGAMISLGSNAHNLHEVARIQRVLQGKESSWQIPVS
ncbi:MAG: hypothetical protein COT73_00315 [Bdellovibrio sp. CG10_big_fil_rev_8_21_14_0_10_47_8]|nr:MAG: hypothetical protein COT73_00315 [Bdellovibrio sp. CG10_big_fil_rev_8_21_14_0_10_47_8]